MNEQQAKRKLEEMAEYLYELEDKTHKIKTNLE